MNTRSIFRMRIKRNESTWTDLRLESKTQNRETYRNWVTEVLSMPGVADTLPEAGVRKALDILTSVFVIRSHTNLELVISCCSVNTYVHLCLGEFAPALEGVPVMFSYLVRGPRCDVHRLV